MSRPTRHRAPHRPTCVIGGCLPSPIMVGNKGPERSNPKGQTSEDATARDAAMDQFNTVYLPRPTPAPSCVGAPQINVIR